MFDKFNKYISEFEMEEFATDYWYDEGAFIAQEILESFETNDWEALLKELSTKSIGWKQRLAYCLHDGNNLKQLEVLLRLIDTDEDSELFELCVDSLRSFTNEESRDLLQKKPQIILKIKELMPKVGDATRRIFEEFLNEN